jgi:hypothetical protein
MSSVSRGTRRTEDDMAEKGILKSEMAYAESLGRDKREIYRKRDGEIFRWNSNHYEIVPNEECQEHALKWLRANRPEDACQPTAASCVKTALLDLPRLRLVHETAGDFDDPTYIIPTRGLWIEALVTKDGRGSVVSISFVKRTPTPTLGVIGDVPVEVTGRDGDPYVPVPRVHPLFTDFLQMSFPLSGSSEQIVENIEAMTALQEFAGYAMLQGGPQFQKALLMKGDGGNGKGVFISLIRRFHPRNAAFVAKQIGQRFAMWPLFGATLATIDEMTEGDFDQGVLKSSISGDALPFERKHKDTVTWRPYAKWIINSNLATGIKSRTPGEGIWRRMIMIAWNHKPTEVVPDLDKTIFRDEAAGVLDWMLIGLDRAIKRGSLFEPSAAKDFKQEARLASDSLLAWTNDLGGKAAVGPFGALLSKKEAVYADYSEWCADNGHKAVGGQTFWTRLYGVFGKTSISLRGKNEKDGKYCRYTNIDLSRRTPMFNDGPDLSAVSIDHDIQALYGMGVPDPFPAVRAILAETLKKAVEFEMTQGVDFPM